MNYYNEIKKKLINNEVTKKVKTYSINKSDLDTYYNVGKLLSEAGNKYGDNIIGEYSKRLISEVGKKYDRSTLFKIRKYYEIFSNEKVAPLVPHLTWSQCLLLIPLKDINKINYYINRVAINHLSKRQLAEIIKSKEYERLPEETKNKLITNNELEVSDLIKDPIVIRKSNNYEEISEKVLQKSIMEDIPSFLKELGEGFTFIDNEYKIKIGNHYNYIDMLLFNIKYNCYVVVELKVTELRKEHIGQIEIYMNYIDKNIKTINQDKTIGLIVCRENNKYIIEYSSDKRIIAREYELVY